jgi:hypothetical protein
MSNGVVNDQRLAKVRFEYVYPPIPDRCFDWSAVFDGEYEPGQPIGRGPTKDTALADLLEQDDERQATGSTS